MVLAMSSSVGWRSKACVVCIGSVPWRLRLCGMKSMNLPSSRTLEQLH
jgi:hypothetical protein